MSINDRERQTIDASEVGSIADLFREQPSVPLAQASSEEPTADHAKEEPPVEPTYPPGDAFVRCNGCGCESETASTEEVALAKALTNKWFLSEHVPPLPYCPIHRPSDRAAVGRGGMLGQ